MKTIQDCISQTGYFTIFIVLFFLPYQIFSQAFEIEGSFKVGDMDMCNECDTLIVAMPDGTFAMKEINSLPGGENFVQSLLLSNDTLFISSGNYIILPHDNSGETLQNLNLSNDTLYISSGNFVVLPESGGLVPPQTLSLNGDTLFISSGNHVVLQEGSAEEIQTLSMAEDTIYLSNGGGYVRLPPDGINDADSDPSNEIQDLSINEDTVFISNGSFIVIPGLRNVQYWDISVQERLNRGASPLDIYRLGFPLDSIYGRSYRGGIIFYLDPLDILSDVDGMVAYPFDIDYNEEVKLEWGCNLFYNPITPATDNPPSGTTANIGAGSSNTMLLIMDACIVGADKAANTTSAFNGGNYDDWYLPSILELNAMYENIGPPAGNGGNFELENYWSSTPADNFETWKIDFSTGQLRGALRNNEYRVRPVRSF